MVLGVRSRLDGTLARYRWHWHFELLEVHFVADDIVMANPFETRIIRGASEW